MQEMNSYTSKNLRYSQLNTLPFPIDSVSFKTINKSHISSWMQEMNSYTSKNLRYSQLNTLPFPIDSVSFKTIKKLHISSLALKWIHTPQRMLDTLNATPYPSRLIPYHSRPSRNHI